MCLLTGVKHALSGKCQWQCHQWPRSTKERHKKCNAARRNHADRVSSRNTTRDRRGGGQTVALARTHGVASCHSDSMFAQGSAAAHAEQSLHAQCVLPPQDALVWPMLPKHDVHSKQLCCADEHQHQRFDYPVHFGPAVHRLICPQMPSYSARVAPVITCKALSDRVQSIVLLRRLDV